MVQTVFKVTSRNIRVTSKVCSRFGVKLRLVCSIAWLELSNLVRTFPAQGDPTLTAVPGAAASGAPLQWHLQRSGC